MRAPRTAEDDATWLSPAWWAGRPRRSRRVLVIQWALFMAFGPTVGDWLDALAVLAWRGLTG